MTDVTRLVGDSRNLKKDQWLAEYSPRMSKSANQMYDVKKILNNAMNTMKYKSCIYILEKVTLILWLMQQTHRRNVTQKIRCSD